VKRLSFIHRISTKIIITLTAVSTLTVIATGSVLLALSSRQMRSNISERNLQIARRASNEIGLYIEDSIRDVQAVSDVLTALDDPWIQDILLENLTVTFKRFDSLTLLTASGRLLASSRLVEERIRFTDARAVAAALTGEIFISPVGLTSEQLPYLTMAVRAGSTAAGPSLLFAQLALRDIWELVDDISFGRQGEAMLLSEQGILIAHPDKTRVMNEDERMANPCIEQPQSAVGTVTVYHPDGGVGMLAACAPVNSLGWSVVIQQPLAEAFLPLQSVLLQSGLLLIAMLAVAVAASLLLTRLFSDPLNMLLAGTYRIGRGDLTHPINLSRSDEIGQLSAAFDRMAEQLRGWSSRLTESEERYRLMAESVQDVIFSLDKEGRLLYANRRAEMLSGHPLAELRGRRCLEYLSSRNRRSIERLLARSLSAELHRGLELEVELKPRSGALRILEVKLVQVFNSSGRLQFFGVARDITQRKQAEKQLLEYQDQLRYLASELSLAEARERKRIAADLHDRIGQALALTRIKLGTLKAGTTSTAKIANIEETIRLIEVTIKEVRTLLFELSSPLLYEVGLKAAVEQLAEQIQEQYGLHVSLEDDGADKPLSIDGSVVLFQAVRELMLNVVKHAAARRVRVSMSRFNGSISILVEDDGAGFNVPHRAFRPGKQGGYGLFSIRERLEYLGGSLVIESDPGHGTRATLAFGLDRDTIHLQRIKLDEGTHSTGR